MANDVKLCNGIISYYDYINNREITNEVELVNIKIREDMDGVEGVARIVELEIIASGVRREILDELSYEIYNKYCNREFFGEREIQEIQAVNLISEAIGVSSDKIDIW